jgi:DNA-binding beta-propeller fold protein YncE
MASVAADPASNRVYVGAANIGYLLVIDGQTNLFQSIITLSPNGVTEFGIAVDAGNKKVWSADYSSNTVTRLRF